MASSFIRKEETLDVDPMAKWARGSSPAPWTLQRRRKQQLPLEGCEHPCAILSLSLPRDKQECLCTWFSGFIPQPVSIQLAHWSKKPASVLQWPFREKNTWEYCKAVLRYPLFLPPTIFAPHILYSLLLFLFVTKQHGSSKRSTMKEDIWKQNVFAKA